MADAVKPATPPPEAETVTLTNRDDIVIQLEKLKKLNASGSLTESDYRSRRQRLLDKQ